MHIQSPTWKKTTTSKLITDQTNSMVRGLLEQLIVIQQVKKFPAPFVDLENPPVCSKKPATGSYPDPVQPS
jgi:hypothetical protein